MKKIINGIIVLLAVIIVSCYGKDREVYVAYQDASKKAGYDVAVSSLLSDLPLPLVVSEDDWSPVYESVNGEFVDLRKGDYISLEKPSGVSGKYEIFVVSGNQQHKGTISVDSLQLFTLFRNKVQSKQAELEDSIRKTVTKDFKISEKKLSEIITRGNTKGW